jgi:hypothetical protein
VRLTRNWRGVEEIIMTIKEFAYSAQQHLEAQSGEKFKRSHIYELLAASFGYNSFAALCTESVVFQRTEESKYRSQSNPALRQRCEELGYPSITANIVFAEFPPFIAAKHITAITFSALIAQLRRQLSLVYGYPDWEDADEFADGDDEENFEDIVGNEWPLFYEESQQEHFSPDLLEGLEIAAAKGNAEAHYALALIHIPSDSDDREPGIDYWYSQEQQGRVLTGVEKEWADEYKLIVSNEKKFEFHLREAGRLGNGQALLDLAEMFEDPSFFEKTKDEANHDPLRVAEIAERLGRTQDVYDWLTKAAEAGYIEAMRRLIEEFDQDDLQRCWTWIYLAELLDTDLTRDDYYAIHEDGSHYDDDVGGPMFAAGRDGIKLPPLTKGEDAVARQKAQILFKRFSD